MDEFDFLFNYGTYFTCRNIAPTLSRGLVEEKEREREEGKTFRMVTYFLQHRLSLNSIDVDGIVKYLMATFISQFADLEDKYVFI